MKQLILYLSFPWQKRASPSAAELENLQTKVFKIEVELSSASDKHQQE